MTELHTSPRGIQFIRDHEGLRLHLYRDRAGFETIGYGHKVQEMERGTFNDPISAAEAERLLQNDLDWAEAAVLAQIKVPLSQAQFDALVSWTFNLGEGNLRASTMRHALLNKDYVIAAAEMCRWFFAAGRPNKGLLLRRMAEAKMFLEGTE